MERRPSRVAGGRTDEVIEGAGRRWRVATIWPAAAGPDARAGRRYRIDGLPCCSWMKAAGFVGRRRGPNLPQTYRNAINGLAAGPDSGCCGRAALRRQAGSSSTILTRSDSTLPRSGAAAGVAAWSRSGDSAGKVLGTFAIYFRRFATRAGEMEQRWFRANSSHEVWPLSRSKRAPVCPGSGRAPALVGCGEQPPEEVKVDCTTARPILVDGTVNWRFAAAAEHRA